MKDEGSKGRERVEFGATSEKRVFGFVVYFQCCACPEGE